MKKEIKELSELLENIIEKKTLEIDSEVESKFYNLVEKLKILSEEAQLTNDELPLNIDHIKILLDKILIKQKKNNSLFEEFKNYLEKKNKKSL
ncbi:hypothetical protein OA848_02510 [Rickettsiales bacterium]|nr:hypothetical protein [Rickettsiales bacterium]